MPHSQRSHGSNPAAPKRWCYCVDFRIGTVVLAVFQIITHLLCMGFLMVLVIRPTLVHDLVHRMYEHEYGSYMGHHNLPHAMQPVNGDGNPRPGHSITPTFHMLIFGRQQTWIMKDKDGKAHAVVLQQISKPMLVPIEDSNGISNNKFPFAVPPRSRRSAVDTNVQAIAVPRNLRVDSLRAEAMKQAPPNDHEKSAEQSQYHFGCHHKRHHILALIGLWISLCFSCGLLYGAAMRQPRYMLPYFGFKVACFFFFLVGLLHSYSYLPRLKEWIIHKPHLPFKAHLLQLGDLQLALIFLSVSWSILLVKLNLLSLVWGCYRLLCMEQHRTRVLQRQAVQIRPTSANRISGSVNVVIDPPALVFLDEPEKDASQMKDVDIEQLPPYKPEPEVIVQTEKEEEDAPLIQA